MLREHVTLEDGNVLTFDYPSKGSLRRVQSVIDPDVHELVAALKRRRTGEELLAYRAGTGWIDIRSSDINEYIKAATGGEFSAKDFRTWNATVLAAVSLSVLGDRRPARTARKRVIALAMEEVAHYLGNTPAVSADRKPPAELLLRPARTLRPLENLVSGARPEAGADRPELEPQLVDSPRQRLNIRLDAAGPVDAILPEARPPLDQGIDLSSNHTWISHGVPDSRLTTMRNLARFERLGRGHSPADGPVRRGLPARASDCVGHLAHLRVSR